MAEQSPVDIPTTAPLQHEGLAFAYRPTPMTVYDDGYALRVDSEPGNHVAIGDHDYELLQFHFHSPAEHTFRGARAPMELHLVHAHEEGTMAVVGIMLVEGARLTAIDLVLSSDRITLDPSDLLPADRAHYTYRGSLTAPPYSEGVAWRVLRQPVELSADQLSRFRAIHDGNARPPQPLHGRSFR